MTFKKVAIALALIVLLRTFYLTDLVESRQTRLRLTPDEKVVLKDFLPKRI